MSMMSVSYSGDQEGLVVAMKKRGYELQAMAEAAKTKKKGVELYAEGRGWLDAAEMVENTKLTS